MDLGLQKYRAFVEAADAGSIAHAAERLGYSVSSISRMVTDLESACGLRLFDRRKAGITLTPDGERLIPRARAIIAECDHFDEEVAAISGNESGTVRIGTISSVATHVLPRMLRDFRKLYPGITCELLMGDYAEIEAWISDGRVDIGTVRLPTRADFDSSPLLEDEHVAIVPKAHRLADADAFPLAAFADEPFIALERGGVSEIEGLFERHGMSVTPVYSVWDDYAVMAMVEAGLGLGILPSVMTWKCPYEVATVPLDVASSRQVAFAWHKQRRPASAAAAFLRMMDR